MGLIKSLMILNFLLFSLIPNGFIQSMESTQLNVKDLGKNEKVIINFSSGGCFHSYKYKIVLDGKHRNTWVIKQIKEIVTDTYDARDFKKIREVKVNEEILQKLQNLLDYYRNRQTDVGSPSPGSQLDAALGIQQTDGSTILVATSTTHIT